MYFQLVTQIRHDIICYVKSSLFRNLLRRLVGFTVEPVQERDDDARSTVEREGKITDLF